MKRSEFISYAEKLNEQQLQKIAEESRERSGSRIPAEVQKQFRSLDDVTEAEEMTINGTHLFKITRREHSSHMPVIINIHGGGWCLPHTERDIYFCRRIAEATGCLILDIDYVLAPEFPYPAALEEIEHLFVHLKERIPEWNGCLDQVILCGQSAGGNLAAALSQRKHIPFRILRQILCYLPADNYADRFGDAELTPRDESTEYYGFFYNRNFEERKNSDVSLVYADAEDLKDVPPTDIITAGLDNLKDEAETYCRLLKDSGIPVTYRCFEHSRHGFLVNLYDEWKEGETYLVSLIRNAVL